MIRYSNELQKISCKWLWTPFQYVDCFALIAHHILQGVGITLFKSITMFCGIENIQWNIFIFHISGLSARYILWNVDSPCSNVVGLNNVMGDETISMWITHIKLKFVSNLANFITLCCLQVSSKEPHQDYNFVVLPPPPHTHTQFYLRW